MFGMSYYESRYWNVDALFSLKLHLATNIWETPL